MRAPFQRGNTRAALRLLRRTLATRSKRLAAKG
jgi:hypothetical protein